MLHGRAKLDVCWCQSGSSSCSIMAVSRLAMLMSAVRQTTRSPSVSCGRNWPVDDHPHPSFSSQTSAAALPDTCADASDDDGDDAGIGVSLLLTPRRGDPAMSTISPSLGIGCRSRSRSAKSSATCRRHGNIMQPRPWSPMRRLAGGSCSTLAGYGMKFPGEHWPVCRVPVSVD